MPSGDGGRGKGPAFEVPSLQFDLAPERASALRLRGRIFPQRVSTQLYPVRAMNDAVKNAFGNRRVETLGKHTYFEPFFARLQKELRALHGTYGAWTGIGVFEPLKQLADDVLRAGGIDIQARSDGSAHVSVPFTPETMPSSEERRAFMLAKLAGQ